MDPETYRRGTDAEIILRIQQRIGNCGMFNPLSNNCETLSNYVRYGREITRQVRRICLLTIQGITTLKIVHA